MNEHLRRAVEALEAGASDMRGASARGAAHVRYRLRETVEQVLVHLEKDQETAEPDPEDVVGRLDRQAKEIAEDLRRVERLMKRRSGME